MKVNFWRNSIRKFYWRNKIHVITPTEYSEIGDNIIEEPIRFQVRIQIGKKWKSRELIIRKEKSSNWNFYIISHEDYSTYEVYDISRDMITQLYDTKHGSKCTVVFTEAVVRIKFNSIQNKWRFIEFLNANRGESKAIQFNGTLDHCPLAKISKNSNLQIFVQYSTMCIIESNNGKVLFHKKLGHDINFVSFVHNFLYFTRFHKREIRRDCTDYWTIRCENPQHIWHTIRHHRKMNHLNYYLVRILEKSA